MSLKILLILGACVSFSNSATTQSLSGTWFFRDGTGAYVDLEGTVPGGIYSDLMENDIIPDIYYGNNDDTTRWVPRSDWTYSTTFRVDIDLLNSDVVNLVFDGLDTFASIVLNDVKIGESQNMFVQYIFNAKDALIAGDNRLEVQFRSPITAAEDLAREQNKTYNIPVNCPPNEYRGECHVNMIRKMQASFSWDWGPSFPSVGIWKDVYIEAYDETVIRYIVPRVEETATAYVVNVDTYFANNLKQQVVGRASYQLKANTISITRLEQVEATPNEYDEIIFSTVLLVPKNYIYTWWPNGYGGQSLYDLTITFTSADQSDQSSKTVRIGFRTIEVVQETVSGGLTFYFKVNGVPIFSKGTNAIPIDILPERGQDRNAVYRVLQSAHNANMNTLRVWGGGVYESDYYYDLADEFGFLVWQDFMFACSLYPVNGNYLNNVLEEVRHQVKRLGSHASIALFSGNNENEGALRDNWYGTQSNFEQYKQDYIQLYIDTIKTEFDRITRGKGIFITSSPTNGIGSDNEGYVAQQPGSSYYGDVHYYNYYLDSFDSTIYPVPRFASEYGFQSLPSVDAFLTATNTISDININSDFMEHRQHHPDGNGELIDLIEYQFKLPDTASPNYYRALVYYSQIVQAVSIRVETEHYRRYRGILNSLGQGNTMGALYWQLNDVWVAPTWSSVDFTGRWKMLHYYATEFFAPIIITGHLDETRTLQVYAVSDIMYPYESVTGLVRVFRWDSFEPLSEEKTATADLDPGKSHPIFTVNIDSYLSEKGCGSLEEARRNCFIYLTLYIEELILIGPNNFVLADNIKNSQVQSTTVRVTAVRKLDDQTFEIDISSDNIALFVWFESGSIGGRFSENGFIEINPSRTIYFYADDNNISEYEMRAQVTVTHLLDPLYF